MFSIYIYELKAKTKIFNLFLLLFLRTKINIQIELEKIRKYYFEEQRKREKFQVLTHGIYSIVSNK